MKKSVVAVAAIVMVIAMVGGAWAAAGDVTVKATVVEKCSAISGNATIDMGNVDGVTDVLGVLNKAITTNTLSLKCTQGANVTITPASASGYKLSDGASHTIDYTLTGNTGLVGGGFGVAGTNVLQAWNLKANIASGGLDAAPAGTYTDIVTVTIAP